MKLRVCKTGIALSLLALVTAQTSYAAPLQVFFDKGTHDVDLSPDTATIQGNIDKNSAGAKGFELLIPNKSVNSQGSITYKIEAGGDVVGSCTVSVNSGTIWSEMAYASSSASSSYDDQKTYKCIDPTKTSLPKTFALSYALYGAGAAAVSTAMHLGIMAAVSNKAMAEEAARARTATLFDLGLTNEIFDPFRLAGGELQHRFPTYKSIVYWASIPTLYKQFNDDILLSTAQAKWSGSSPEEALAEGKKIAKEAFKLRLDNFLALFQLPNEFVENSTFKKLIFDMFLEDVSKNTQMSLDLGIGEEQIAKLKSDLQIDKTAKAQPITAERLIVLESELAKTVNAQNLTEVFKKLNAEARASDVHFRNGGPLNAKTLELTNKFKEKAYPRSHSILKWANGIGVTGILLTLAMPSIWMLTNAVATPPSYTVKIVENNEKMKSLNTFARDSLLVSTSTPTGEMLASRAGIELLGPNGWAVYVPEGTKNDVMTNPAKYPLHAALKGKLSVTPKSYFDEKTQRSNMLIGTTGGLQVLSFDTSANLAEVSNTLFAGKEVSSLSLYQGGEGESNRAIATLSVSNKVTDPITDQEIIETQVYRMRDSAKSISAKTTEADFVLITQGATDGYGHSYYADAENPAIKVIKNGESTFSETGLAGLKIEKFLRLPNGRLLAFAQNELFISTPEGRFEVVPAGLIDFKSYDSFATVNVPKASADGKPVTGDMTVIFYASNPAANKIKGAQLVTFPADIAERSFAGWKVENIFANHHVLSYDMEHSYATLAKTLTEEEKFADIETYFVSPQTLKLEKVVAGSYSSSAQSPYLFYALAEGGVRRLHMQTSEEVLLPENVSSFNDGEEEEAKKIFYPLANANTILFSKGNKVKIIESTGSKLIDEIQFEEGTVVYNLASFTEEKGFERIYAATNTGLHVLEPVLNANEELKGYKHAFTLFEAFNIANVDHHIDGRLIVYSDEAFPEGASSSIKGSEIDEQNQWDDGVWLLD